jgi:photosystem II stability/assembly factor-like uncharacterized protein
MRSAITILALLLSTCLSAQIGWSLAWTGDVTAVKTVGEDRVLFTAYYDQNIYYSDDLATTVQSFALPYSPAPAGSPTVHKFTFLSDLEGWLAVRTASYESYVFKTSDGGSTWTQLWVSSTSVSFADIYFKDSNTGWAANGWVGEVWKTVDGGVTWAVELDATHASAYPNDIFFVDEDHGWITGYNVVFRTVDGGLSWTEHTQSASFHAAHFWDANNGIASTRDYGKMMETNDGGVTWTVSYENLLLSEMTELHFSTPQTGYWTGGLECRHGTCHGMPDIYKTVDGGQSWTEQSHNAADTLISFGQLEFSETGVGYMASREGLLINTNSVGIEGTAAQEPLIEVYHNQNQLHIKLAGTAAPTEFTLLDFSGKVVAQRRLTSSLSLPTQHLASGVYVVRFETASSVNTRKIVITK